MIIGIHGVMGSGKDTIAEMMHELYPDTNFQNKKFATTIKMMVSTLTGLSLEQLEDPIIKATPLPKFGNVTPRLMLQKLGTEFGRDLLHKNVWVWRLLDAYSEQNDNWLITDLRFPNEYDAIRKLGGKVIKVVRPTQLMLNGQHSSESSLEKVSAWDKVFINDRTKEDLKIEVKNWLSKQNF